LIGALDVAVNMLTERQKGLFRRLRAAPISRATLLGSRLLSGALVTAIGLASLYAFGAIFLKVKIAGSPAGFVLIGAGFACMASGFGLLMSTIGKTPQAARGVGILAILLATALSGAWLPAFLFPPWLQKATLVVPSRWAIDGLDAMTWRGLDLSAALAPAAILFASAAVMIVLALWRFRWEE
jgi:ABC-2 type transport system permease protein